jgi:glycine oxidase
MTDQRRKNRVAVIGGGIIGLGVGWQLARRGHDVTIFERDDAGRGASWVAAGMLAPVSEFGFENEDFLELGRRSMALFPEFLEQVSKDAGTPVALDTRGTLVVGFNHDDNERIRRVYNFREEAGLPVRWLTGTEARDIEPLLSPRASGAMWIPEDHQVDNRLLVGALKTAFENAGGTLHERTPVESLVCEYGRFRAVATPGGDYCADTAVLAAGCWSGKIPGLPEELIPRVRPVKGQIVSLKTDASYEFAHVIRAPDCYVLPKGDGRVLVGATEEEMGYDTTATAGPVMRLIERAWEAVPSVYDLAIDSIDVGLRPGTRDHEPLLGDSGIEGLILATGHYRHGILLAPITAQVISDAVEGVPARAWLKPFAPSRFNAGGGGRTR